MKKVISGILVAVIVASLSLSAFAAEESELTRVVKTAKSAILPPAEYTEFSSEKYEVSGLSVYSLMWHTQNGEKVIECQVLASGEIVSYYTYDRTQEQKTGVAVYTEEEYLSFAEVWFKKVNPAYSGEINFSGEVSVGSIHSDTVRVTFRREKDGVEVFDNFARVILNKFTGEVRSMSVEWQDARQIEEKEGVITPEAAGEKLAALSQLYLAYEKPHDEEKARLVYVPKKRGLMIFAKTGESFEVEYVSEGDGAGASGALNDMATSEKAESALTEKELSAIAELEGLLTKSELSAKIKEMGGTEVALMEAESLNYIKTELHGGEHTYYARVGLRGESGSFGTVTFEARTGELLGIYTYLLPKNSRKNTQSRETMQKRANGFIALWAEDIKDETALFESEYTAEGSFNFVQMHDGVPYCANSVSVTCDTSSGRIIRYSRIWDKTVRFEEKEGCITLLDATEKYIEASAPKLYYIADGRNSGNYMTARELVLIYAFSETSFAYIDAMSGQTVAYGFAEDKKEKYEPQKDLEGHFALSAVKTLSENGIILTKDESFRPDEKITVSELVRLVMSFERGMYIEPDEDTEEQLMREAFARGLLDAETRPDAMATREVAASVIIRLLGYKKASEIQGIYKTGFKDEAKIKPTYLGAVAIAKGLGIINGRPGGNFDPKGYVTRGEAAVILFGSLGK
ncbi:MAG: S-layer homology domain-containing protein [Oscillospiraceae bacterium]|nr:S-layer homology domain-containing protein [Oscillospiraceae bacterium]